MIFIFKERIYHNCLFLENLAYSAQIWHWELFNFPSLPNVINWSQFKFVPLSLPQVCTPAQNTWDYVGETYITSLIQMRWPHGPYYSNIFTTCLFLWCQKDCSWVHIPSIAVKILLSPRTPGNNYLCLFLSQAYSFSPKLDICNNHCNLDYNTCLFCM